VFGENAIEKLPAVMAAIGKRVLLTYGGGSIKKIGLYDRVKELLKDFEITELSGIQPNPKYDPSVLDGVRLCKENNIDVILAVGGGSVLDCSKAIAAGAKYDGDPWDLISYKVKAQAALPIVDILTLAATGSEYDCGGVISRTETNDKIGYLDPNYPGTLTMSEDKTKLTYTPDGAHTGSVTILSVLTDGSADSKVGAAVFNLTGSGSPISVAAPTTIPADVYIPVAIKQVAAPSVASSLKVGRENVTLGLVKSGRVTVDVYSVKGLRVKNLLDQNLSAGVHTVGFDASSIPAGTYIVRMRQGSTIKSQWFVNR
jgi:hypothetical protein